MRKTIIAGYVALVALAACRNGMEKKALGGGAGYQNETQSKKRVVLSDGTAVILAPGTKVELGSGFDQGDRQMSLDGEAWFDVVRGPMTLHTRDLSIEVLQGGKFHAEAFRSRPGEEVDLLEGGLRVKKSYHSDTDNEPELLGSGDMVMVNRDIDLMEKEKLNPAELDKLKGGW